MKQGKTKNHRAARQGESGNLFFYIFLAVALLGALTFAVSRGGRSGVEGLAEDRERLVATEILSYADSIKKTVSQLRLRGSKFSDLRFAHADLDAGYGAPGASAAHEIFHRSGGAAIYQAASTEATDSPQDWVFTAANEADLAGSTCGAAACSDLLLLLPDVKRGICLQINDLLGIPPDASGDPPKDTAVDAATLFAGSESYAETIGDEPDSAALSGRQAGCFLETASGNYFFYQVLSAR